MSPKHIRIEQQSDVWVITFTDQKIIDESTVQKLGTELLAFVNRGHQKVVLNFETVTFMSAFALNVLVRVARVVKENGGQLKMVEVKDHVREIIHISRLDRMFKIRPHLQDALDAFTQK